MVAYHDFEGITIHAEEGPRVLKSIGTKQAVILRNHGLLSWGSTVPETFAILWTLQRACEIQLATFSMGPAITVSDALYAEALRRRGCAVVGAPWDGPRAAFDGASAVVIRSTWGYYRTPEAFRDWTEAMAAASHAQLPSAQTHLHPASPPWRPELRALRRASSTRGRPRRVCAASTSARWRRAAACWRRASPSTRSPSSRMVSMRPEMLCVLATVNDHANCRSERTTPALASASNASFIAGRRTSMASTVVMGLSRKARNASEGAIGAPVAVVNAICDALAPFGVTFYEMPVTPQRIRAALRNA